MGNGTLKQLGIGIATLALLACGGGGGGSNGGNPDFPEVHVSGGHVADYRVANEAALRTIPAGYVDTARSDFHVAYFHTSHGTHVSYGLFGLPDYKSGDDTLFGITNNAPVSGKLDFRDFYTGASPYEDLSQADADWAAWRDQVRGYLNDPDNAAINVVMWSWCDIANHDVTQYLSSMQTLIDEYGPGGSAGRGTSVTFIFMTGHANRDNNTGPGNPRDQAALITDYCDTHGYYCLDYYSIDTHAMDGRYFQDASDNCDSTSYGGNFCKDWLRNHPRGAWWYNNRNAPGGSAIYGEHNNQPLTANRKAFAFWWLLARMAGYDG